MSTVIEIVKAHLVAGGFDGLVQADAECGCKLDDLAPCCDNICGCEPGFIGVDPAGIDDWVIFRDKEAAEASKQPKESA